MKKLSFILALTLLVTAWGCGGVRPVPATEYTAHAQLIQEPAATEAIATEPFAVRSPEDVVVYPFSVNDRADAQFAATDYLQKQGAKILRLDYDPVAADAQLRQELTENPDLDEELSYPCRIAFAAYVTGCKTLDDVPVSASGAVGVSLERKNPTGLWRVRQLFPISELSETLLPQSERETLDVDGMAVLAGYRMEDSDLFYLHNPADGTVVCRHYTAAEAVTHCGQRSPLAVWNESTWQTCPALSPEPGDTAATYDPGRINAYPADSDCSPMELLEKWMAVEGLTMDDLEQRGCRQLLLTVSLSSYSANTVNCCFERNADGQWEPVSGLTGIDGWSGSKGIMHSRQRDTYKSPIGLWPLGTAFGIKEKPEGVRMPWRDVTPYSDWVGDWNSAYYNTWQEQNDSTVEGTWSQNSEDVEHLIDYKGYYDYAVAIRYNAAPYTLPSRGYAIFLHCSTGPTAGCIGLREDDMVQVLQWLDPTCRPYILITGHE